MRLLLRMRHDIDEVVDVALNLEVKSPPFIHPGLPDVPGLIVFFGPQGGVTKVLDQKGDAPVKRSPDLWRGALVASTEAFRVVESHQGLLDFLDLFVRLRRERTISWAERKGP